MSTGRRWLIALAAVAVVAIFYRTQTSDPDRAATAPTETRTSETSALQGAGRSVPTSPSATGSARDAPAAADVKGRERSEPARNADASGADSRADALATEPSPSPAAQALVRTFGGADIWETAPFQDDLRQFAAEPIDRVWSANIEARLLSGLAQSRVALVDRHIECRTTICGALLVYPFGTEVPDVAVDAIESLGRSLDRRLMAKAFFFPRPDGAPAALLIFTVPREATTQSVTQFASFD